MHCNAVGTFLPDLQIHKRAKLAVYYAALPTYNDLLTAAQQLSYMWLRCTHYHASVTTQKWSNCTLMDTLAHVTTNGLQLVIVYLHKNTCSIGVHASDEEEFLLRILQ